MNILHDVEDFCSVLGAIVVLFVFIKNFKNLTSIQKLGIASLLLGILIPASIDFTNGFISGFLPLLIYCKIILVINHLSKIINKKSKYKFIFTLFIYYLTILMSKL